MSQHTRTAPALLSFVLGVAVAGLAGDLAAQDAGSGPAEGQGVPFQFQAGQPARADEINQNFDQLVSMDAILLARIDSLEAELAAVQDTTRFLSTSEESINGLLGPHLIVEGANLHVRSGSGATDDGGAPLGVGNLVVGYNEEPSFLSASERLTSHTLVLGLGHRYMGTGCVVAGRGNTVSGLGASVLGGIGNRATGASSTVSGGASNVAEGNQSSVAGGFNNTAQGERSTITGGEFGLAIGASSSVAGGSLSTARGDVSSVLGGRRNEANGLFSVVVGGDENVAAGTRSVVSGGVAVQVSETNDWAACDQSCN